MIDISSAQDQFFILIFYSFTNIRTRLNDTDIQNRKL